MCRSIKKLRKPEGLPTDEEIKSAALQFVRKISGYHHPSKAKQAVFDQAVDDVAKAAQKLCENMAVEPV